VVGGAVVACGLGLFVVAGLGMLLWFRAAQAPGVVAGRIDAQVAPLPAPAKDINPQTDKSAPQDDSSRVVHHDLNKTDTPSRLTGQQIYSRLLKSAVWVNNPGMGWGTGVLINAQDRLAITNYHVVCKGATPSGLDVLQTIEETLTKADPVDPGGKFPCKSFEFEFVKKFRYQIDMVSGQLDSYLRVIDSGGNVVAADDDGGGNLNARIKEFSPPKDGKYRVIATSFDGSLGDFTLVISRISPNKKVVKVDRPTVVPFVEVNFPAFADGQLVVDRGHYKRLNKTDKDKCKAQVLYWSEANDLAVLKLNAVPEGVLGLPLAREPGRPGQPVHSIGNPGSSGALWVYTSGTVRTAPYKKQWQSFGEGILMKHDAWIIETQSPTNPGDSGGPLVNEAAELLAVAQGVNLGANSINLFIDVREIREFLKSHNLGWVEN
jgi:S1-C subfamily serine protease